MIYNIENKFDDYLFEQELMALKLVPMRDFIRANNPGKDLPYHNTRHMEGVAKIAVRLARLAQIDHKHVKELATAALWHDYDHSGGKLVDSANIDRAVSAMRYHVNEQEWLYEWPRDREYSLARIEGLVRVTEFPFIRTPTITSEKILRDADLLYSFCSNSGEIALGLYHELGQAGKLGGYPEKVSGLQFMDNQLAFLSGATFYTQEAQDLRDLLLEDVLAAQKKVFYKNFQDAETCSNHYLS